MPIADSYLKFLLKSAVVETDHLKSIDVICLDDDDSVKKRYDEFLEFKYYKFVNTDVREYLNLLAKQYTGSGRYDEPMKMDKLEGMHTRFMRGERPG